jgi:hypothetical protein
VLLYGLIQRVTSKETNVAANAQVDSDVPIHERP